jgi:hypothetical protein
VPQGARASAGDTCFRRPPTGSFRSRARFPELLQHDRGRLAFLIQRSARIHSGLAELSNRLQSSLVTRSLEPSNWYSTEPQAGAGEFNASHSRIGLAGPPSFAVWPATGRAPRAPISRPAGRRKPGYSGVGVHVGVGRPSSCTVRTRLEALAEAGVRQVDAGAHEASCRSYSSRVQ